MDEIERGGGAVGDPVLRVESHGDAVSNPSRVRIITVGTQPRLGTTPTASQPTVIRERVEDIASDWPVKPRDLANEMMDEYGVPDEVIQRRIFWHDVGAWKRVLLLPVPPDLVLIPLAVARPEFALVYAVIATAGSVSAGLVGFILGLKGGRPALESRFSDDRIDRAEEYVDQRGFEALTFGAFAPIPEGYELLSIASGVFRLDSRSYLLASVAGRGGRYFLEATIVLAIGEAARSFTAEELYMVIGVAALLVLTAYLLRKHWLPENWRTRAQ